jgi:hypothetical protein
MVSNHEKARKEERVPREDWMPGPKPTRIGGPCDAEIVA